MNKEQKASIIKRRSDGMAFSEIADHLHLSINWTIVNKVDK